MDALMLLAVLHTHACTIVSRRARLHCMTMCRIGVVLCVCEALERG